MATSLAIADLITDRLSESERILMADDNADWANAKLRAIALSKLEVYGSEPSESDITDGRIKEYIALLACVRLCDIAINFLAHNKRLGDSKQGATLTNYNLAEILRLKKIDLRREIAEKAPGVLDLIDNNALADASIDVSTLHDDHIAGTYKSTPSPWAMGKR